MFGDHWVTDYLKSLYPEYRLPDVFSCFQRGVLTPTHSGRLNKWDNPILQAVFGRQNLAKEHVEQPHFQHDHHFPYRYSRRPFTIQTFPTNSGRQFLFISLAKNRCVFFHRPNRPLSTHATADVASRWTAESGLCGAMISLISKSLGSFRW